MLYSFSTLLAEIEYFIIFHLLSIFVFLSIIKFHAGKNMDYHNFCPYLTQRSLFVVTFCLCIRGWNSIFMKCNFLPVYVRVFDDSLVLYIYVNKHKLSISRYAELVERVWGCFKTSSFNIKLQSLNCSQIVIIEGLWGHSWTSNVFDIY